MSEFTGYCWLPVAGTDDELENYLGKYLKNCVLQKTAEEAYKLEEEAYESQWSEFKLDGPMMLVKITVDVLFEHEGAEG